MKKMEDAELIYNKRDSKGRIYREVRCMKCRAFLCDEYVRIGRLRLTCFKCGTILIMDFKPDAAKKAKLQAKGTKKV